MFCPAYISNVSSTSSTDGMNMYQQMLHNIVNPEQQRKPAPPQKGSVTTESESYVDEKMMEVYLDRVKDQFSRCCQFFRALRDEFTGEIKCTPTLFLPKHFDIISDDNSLTILENQTGDNENKTVAFWTKTFDSRPCFRELCLLLILIHSIPPTTVDVERIFKTTKKLENEGRASLSGSTKEMLTVLNLALHEEQPFKPSEKWGRN